MKNTKPKDGRAKAEISVAIPPMDAEDIVERVVEKLADHMSGEVGRLMEAAVQRVFDERVQKAADKAVSDFLTKRIPQTSRWGETTGEAISVTEYVLKKFEEHMKQKVGMDGRPADYDRGIPRHDWLIQQFGLKEIEKVAAAEIGKVRKAAEVQISAAVGNFIAQNIVAPVAATSLPRQ